MPPFPHIGSSVIELSEIDSTNNYAMELASGGLAEHGLVVATNYQTQGKGQQGNRWKSAKEKNLLFSIVLDTAQQDIATQFLLNAAFCSALAYLLMDEYELPATSIKWPNDIYIGKKKIAGILIENVVRGQQWQYAIVGIGINVNQQKFGELNTATSVRNELNREINLIPLRKKVFEYLNTAYHNFLTKPTTIIEEYNSLLYGINENIFYTKKAKKHHGTLHGAAQQGFLKIGAEQYRHGEIKIIL